MGTKYVLSRGNHAADEGRLCAAEWVAHLAGESHTDRPKTMSPILREFIVWLNDDLPTRTRQKLRPYLSRMIGTAGDGHDDERFVALYEYGMDTEVGGAFVRPTYSVTMMTVDTKSTAIMFKKVEEAVKLHRRPAPPDGFYYARMAAAIAASRREVPKQLMEDLLPTVQMGTRQDAHLALVR